MKKQIILSLFLASLLILPQALSGQNKTVKKWNQKRIDALVITVNEEIFQGQILSADDEKVELWMSKDPFSSTRKDVEIKTFAPEEINQIKLSRRGRFGKRIGLLSGTITGFLIAASLLPPSDNDIGINGNENSAARDVIGASIIGLTTGAILGSAWGLSTRVYKKIRIEGEKENYFRKLPILKTRSLNNNEWGNEFYWERREG